MDWRSEVVEPIPSTTPEPNQGWRSRIRSMGHVLKQLLTAIPLALAGLGLMYLALKEPLFGGGVFSRTFLLIFLVGALANLIARYFRQRMAERVLASQDVRQEEYENRSALQRLFIRLEVGFANVGSSDGISALRGLKTEWDELSKLFLVRKPTDPMALGQAAVIAEETFHNGLGLLRDAQDLLASAGLNERKKLEWEITELTSEIDAASGDETRDQARDNNLELRKNRLNSIDELRSASERLVYQAHRCEQALQRTRIELAAMRFGGTDERIDDAVEALNDTMRQVKEVRAELEQYGY